MGFGFTPLRLSAVTSKPRSTATLQTCSVAWGAKEKQSSPEEEWESHLGANEASPAQDKQTLGCVGHLNPKQHLISAVHGHDSKQASISYHGRCAAKPFAGRDEREDNREGSGGHQK